MSSKSFSILSALIFLVVALVHLARAVGLVHVAVTIAQFSLPVSWSWAAFAVTAVLTVLGFRAAGR